MDKVVAAGLHNIHGQIKKERLDYQPLFFIESIA
jgi:hypothetical protein